MRSLEQILVTDISDTMKIYPSHLSFKNLAEEMDVSSQKLLIELDM